MFLAIIVTVDSPTQDRLLENYARCSGIYYYTQLIGERKKSRAIAPPTSEPIETIPNTNHGVYSNMEYP
jgi:hypothetical protein